MRAPGGSKVPRKILIIDDSPLVLEVTRSALEHAGYIVSTATTLDAFEQERRTPPAPDLILVDVQMPEVFGDDLASTVRGAYGELAPIVLLSSLDDAELSERARTSEAHGWISKRAGLDALLAKIAEVLGAEATKGGAKPS